jgi:gelsolin
MLKQKQLNLEDSNIAGLGSDLDKKIRLEASNGEPAWKTAGKAPGLEIWRVEKFKIVPVPRNLYGSFYSGDSYIVLHTYKKPNAEALLWDVHFWLGQNTTQDEAGTAAYKTVELDDHLGGAPIQHREVQDYESSMFLSYFKPGIRVLEGGVDTGFHHVGPKEYKPRLLQLKGKKNIRLRQVPLELGSLNSGDVFILDLGMKLIQFNGKQSSGIERAKAAELCRALDTEREGKPEVVVFEENDKDYPKEWLDTLGAKGPIKDAKAGGDDLLSEQAVVNKSLWRLSDASGKMTMTKEAEGKDVAMGKLDGADVFILDVGREVFVWIGAGTTAEERKYGLKYAEQYLKDQKRPLYTPISRVIQGGENDYFRDAFKM